MSTARESIEVAVPARIAYEQLAHFENYPRFMSGVMSMAPIDESTAHMVLDIGGSRAEFDARITEARPGEFLCWEAMDGPQVSEALRLEPMADGMTRIIAELQIDARELMPAEEHAAEVLNRRLKADLKGFKRFCEEGATRMSNAPTKDIPAAAQQTSAAGTIGGDRDKPTAASIARGIASASGLTHATNERPNPGVPAGGNLGPMHHSMERNARTRQAQQHDTY
ncbi:SRPBCC family protein [Dactylosporangium roseum]|uniref:SRPBCC family protein n=1 Tax=Dactylosporangium roseum TaxID=47989 RepID=A0ABY5Z0N0_9ACTN|nr:SRPBCC family protein [Dactylosporangium roseum]UWZ35576.1 SRPBCC family protein [Dactylosporangium roseum]